MMAPSRTSVSLGRVPRALLGLAATVLVACAHATAASGEPASAAPGLAASEPAAPAAPADEVLVADAMDRRAAWLKAGCPEHSRQDRLPEAAAALRAAAGGPPGRRARAVDAASRALTVAAAEAYLCPAPAAARTGRHVLQSSDFSILDPSAETEATVGSGHLRDWGEPDADAAWARLARQAAQPRVPPRHPEVCRCMGEPTRGLPILYGYPSATMSLAAYMQEGALGGCIVTDDSPRLACSSGCRPDRLRLGESLSASELRDLDIREGGPVLLGLAGTPAAADASRRVRLDPADYTALATCLGEEAEARAVHGHEAWVPLWEALPADRCLADWLTPRFAEPGLDNAGARTRAR